jgi:hypothetical protein
MTVGSGRQCAMWCKQSSPLGVFSRILLESSAWGNSEEFCYVWNRLDTYFACSAFQLTPLGRDTEDNECSLWPTPDAAVANDGESVETWLARAEELKAKGYNGNGAGMPLAIAAKLWPTPHQADGTGGGSPIRHDPNVSGGRSNLRDVVKLWPTPIERDWKSTSHANKDNARPLSEVAGLTGQGSLNPEFVEWLMMFQIGHTALCHPLSQKKESQTAQTD